MFSAIPNIIPGNLIDPILDQIQTQGWHYGWRSSKVMGYSHWNIDFAQADSSNGLDVAHKLPQPLLHLWQHLQATLCPDTVLLRCYTNSHTFGVEGYPHADSKRQHERTLVIYLNKHWHREWGGETLLYDDQRVLHAELPRFNHGLVFDSDLWHCARGVTRICPAQRITLMFKFAPQGMDPDRDRLQVLLAQLGTEQIDHSGRCLFNHLLSVYDILKRRGLPPHVCLAGGTHSIFGTTVFATSAMALDQRPQLVDVVGDQAADLVDLFRVLDRPRVLDNWCHNPQSPLTNAQGQTLQLDPDVVAQLCQIECANLEDQKSLDRRAGLHKFWNDQ
jgi:hypothetical protein|nr:2OG-Fe(II) oxygenase [Oxalobacteraceae bacterium]